MSEELTPLPAHTATMEALERLKKSTKSGVEYWLARDIHEVLGYPTWREFQNVLERAQAACDGAGIDPAKHFVLTTKMVGLGGGAQREQDDYYLSRSACYLVAINGQPSKPEIAAAQVYFTVQARRMEIEQQRAKDEKRLELRDKVTVAFKRVSGVAKEAGVADAKQALFHDARYQGLYGRSTTDVKRAKGLAGKDNLFDRAGPLELSAHEFQMNLAADVLVRDNIRSGEQAIIKNRQVGEHVRKTIKDAGGTMPEKLALEDPIKEVKKRLAPPKAKAPAKPRKKPNS